MYISRFVVDPLSTLTINTYLQFDSALLVGQRPPGLRPCPCAMKCVFGLLRVWLWVGRLPAAMLLRGVTAQRCMHACVGVWRGPVDLCGTGSICVVIMVGTTFRWRPAHQLAASSLCYWLLNPLAPGHDLGATAGPTIPLRPAIPGLQPLGCCPGRPELRPATPGERSQAHPNTWVCAGRAVLAGQPFGGLGGGTRLVSPAARRPRGVPTPRPTEGCGHSKNSRQQRPRS